MGYKLRFSQYNASSVLVEWPPLIDENILNDVLSFKNKIEKINIKCLVEVVTAYNSLLIIYNFTIDDINNVFKDLKALYLEKSIGLSKGSKVIKIPVCYDADFGEDLMHFSKVKKISKSELIELHTAPLYTVFFLGFLPGFLYLGGLNRALHLNRKTTPNLNIKKGSVAIGGKQTGIYPQDSPGGWHIIGNSPIELFNPNDNPPSFINAGDQVKFYAISKPEYVEIQAEIQNSKFNIETLFVND
ncbi:5-oxoprolinase subunit PxpB [Winogradskyella eckloniae]|uniref:5-oxoprolinase subunit PxpB n=1 Tax=Winogradskyella eckloniae TaxID=1089306 RepID=UPI001567435E|nr:5-oxoprolinase subunit PxpB [Winogradskyella eckloniae]NRD19924.1 5-oxoprolinase subunit PxpB [Winogradskyella eckloniae]